jgi:hypothetical protein
MRPYPKKMFTPHFCLIRPWSSLIFHTKRLPILFYLLKTASVDTIAVAGFEYPLGSLQSRQCFTKCKKWRVVQLFVKLTPADFSCSLWKAEIASHHWILETGIHFTNRKQWMRIGIGWNRFWLVREWEIFCTMRQVDVEWWLLSTLAAF